MSDKFNSFLKPINRQIVNRWLCQDQATALLQLMGHRHEIRVQKILYSSFFYSIHFWTTQRYLRVKDSGWPWMKAGKCVNEKELPNYSRNISIALEKWERERKMRKRNKRWEGTSPTNQIRQHLILLLIAFCQIKRFDSFSALSTIGTIRCFMSYLLPPKEIHPIPPTSSAC